MTTSERLVRAKKRLRKNLGGLKGLGAGPVWVPLYGAPLRQKGVRGLWLKNKTLREVRRRLLLLIPGNFPLHLSILSLSPVSLFCSLRVHTPLVASVFFLFLSVRGRRPARVWIEASVGQYAFRDVSVCIFACSFSWPCDRK